MNKTDTKSSVLLKHHLKILKLPTMHAECEKIAQRCAADNADHLAYLLQLCELELIERERKAAERRLKAAPEGARQGKPTRQRGLFRNPGRCIIIKSRRQMKGLAIRA